MTQSTRDKIIQTAADLIDQTGSTDITLAQIAQELGMTHAALYKHFKNKQALWEAVTMTWFSQTILHQVQPKPATTPTEQLHTWLWDLVNAKKQTFNTNPPMFDLNTRYVDNNPLVLRAVLQPAYQTINTIMGYPATDTQTAEAILSAFATFMLPNFSSTWNLPDYQQRFETIWQLMAASV